MSAELVIKKGPDFLRHAARLKIYPRPINVAERRQIFQHLHKYGDILFFKSLYYDRTVHALDSALLIFRHYESLQRLQQESPVKVKVIRRPFDPISLHWTYNKLNAGNNPLALESSENQVTNPHAPRDQQEVPLPTTKLRFNVDNIDHFGNERSVTMPVSEVTEHDEEIEFLIKAEPWRGGHRARLEQSPYWGPFKINQSMLQKAMNQEVPVVGLSDVSFYRQVKPLPVHQRQNERGANKNLLRQIYEDGLRESLVRKPTTTARGTASNS